MEERAKRKLSAILSADVKGYSRLMGEDELGTVRTLEAHREMLAEVVRNYSGRVVDSPGDNVLAEFSSVVDAVESAVEIQKELKAKNAELPENRKMEFRIGINLGDVIEEGDRIYGDGINIAARIQCLSDSGGICISGSAYEQIVKKLPLGYEYLGEQTVKNIEKPVRLYRVLMEPEAVGKVIGEKRPIRWRWAAIAVALILVVGAAVIWNFYLRPPPIEPASVEKMAFPLPDKPSIAVLPFANIGGDPEQDHFSDGLAENIITQLSQVHNLFVIARNSSFTYKGKSVKVQQVAEELGVRYVLEGSVQRENDRIRVTAQLIDATTGRHLWADRYDRQLKDIFAIQDDVTQKIVTEMAVKLGEGDNERLMGHPTGNVEAWTYYRRGVEEFRKFTPESNAKSRELAEKAIELDPDYSNGYALLGWTYAIPVRAGFSKSPTEDLNKAEELAAKAQEVDAKNLDSQNLSGFVYMLRGDYDRAIVEGKKAVELGPSFPDTHALLALSQVFAGQYQEAVAGFKQAMRLAPFYPWWYANMLGQAYFCLGLYEEALHAFEETLKRTAATPWRVAWKAATYQALGRHDEATAATEEALRLKPTFSVEEFQKLRLRPFRDKSQVDRILTYAREAGLPETPPLPLPDKPSIVVLPFANMSEDPKQEYFSDGITEDIITDLSKVSGLFVIARNSSFSYKGKQVKAQHVAKDLGVRYVLEGSVRRAGNRLRITAQLIDAETGDHLWAERYDRGLKDIFSVQDQVAQKVVSELAVTLKASESERLYRKHTENIEVYDLYLRIIREYWPPKKEDYLKALELSKRVIELDPEFGGGYQLLSFFRSMGVRLGYSPSPREDVEKALELAQKAVSVDDTFAPSYIALASAYLMKRQHEDALAAATAAVRIEPGGYNSNMWLGFYLHWMGRGEEAVKAIKKAQQLNPKYLSDRVPWILDFMGFASFTAGQYEESIAAMKKSLDRFGPFVPREAFLTAAYSELSRDDEAKAMARQLLKRHPKFSLTSWKFARVYKNPKDTERLLDALRRAGLK